jgi:hypothetical protein
MRKDVGLLLARIERAKPQGDAQLAAGAAPRAAPAAQAHAPAGAH